MLPDEGPHVEKWERSVFHNFTMLNESQEHGSGTSFLTLKKFVTVQKICEVNYKVNNSAVDTIADKWDEVQTNKHARVTCRDKG